MSRYTRFSRVKFKKVGNLTIVKHLTNSMSVSWKDGRRVCSPDTAVKAAGGEPPFRYNCTTTIMIVDEKIFTFCQQENKVLSKTVDGWVVQVIKAINSNFMAYLVQRNLDFRPSSTFLRPEPMDGKSVIATLSYTPDFQWTLFGLCKLLRSRVFVAVQ